jgi:CxxC-x17-CxxC domain-containing protein
MTEKNKEQINFFAQTNFRNKEQPFGIKVDDRRRHFYTLGKTGMGKTSLIQNMAIQDIQNGNGVAVVDPHGEFAEECLKAVPPERIKDVIYFNPADLNFPVSLNIMEKVDPEYRHLVSSGLIGVFKKLWADSWGPRLEYILRNAILALLCHPSSTLLGINRLLVDKQYREEVLSYVDDPVVSAFWVDEFSKYNDRLLTEAISPIQNKVGQFLSSGLIRNIVGQTESSFNIREAMDEGKILIMNLSKGHIGEDSSALLGAMMITKVQLAAMSRVDTPEDKRRDFYLYVDEFQNFATESFAGILSEARKYRLNLILAHQFMAQLDETVLNAVLGNVGTIVSFRVGALDTEILEKEFEPTFYANDLVNLDKYNIYLKLMIDGVSTRPFSAQTLFPIDVSKTEGDVDKVIKTSREQYANSKEYVEQAIMDWSGMKNPGTVQNIKAFAQQGTGGGSGNQNNRQKSGGNNTNRYNGDSQQKKTGQYNNKTQNNQQKHYQKRPTNNRTQNNRSASSQLGNNFNDELGIGGLSSGATNVTSKISNVDTNQEAQHNRSLSKKDSAQQVEKKNNTPHNLGSKEKVEKPKVDTQQQAMTIVNCSGCEKETEINFIPDGVRPVFCQDCLREYRREQSKIQQSKISTEEGNNNDKKQSSSNKFDNQDRNSNKGTVKVVQGKKGGREKVDSLAVQNLIKDAMSP